MLLKEKIIRLVVVPAHYHPTLSQIIFYNMPLSVFYSLH